MNICNCEDCEKDYDDEIAALKSRVAELEKENYNLQHSITQAIDPRRGDTKKGKAK